MLCRVSLTLPGQSRMDKSITRKVIDENHASSDAGSWHSNLWPKPAIEYARAVGGKLRREIELITGPYFVDGLRILPAGLYMKAMEKGRNILPEFDRVKWESAQRLDEWKEIMRRNNGLYRPELYPNTPEQMAALFNLELRVMPLPDADNFLILQMANDAIEEVRNDYQSQIDSAIQEHERELFDRFMDSLLRMAKVLSAEKPRIFETLLGNVRQIVEALPHLNLTHSAKLDELQAMGTDMIQGVTTSELKESDTARQETLNKVNAILAQMKGYGANP